MKYQRAWKVCGRCLRDYRTVEYSLSCPDCKEIDCAITGKSVSTVRSYERLIWSDPEMRKDFEWTLIGLLNKETNTYTIKYIYDCWPQEFKDFLEAEIKKQGIEVIG